MAKNKMLCLLLTLTFVSLVNAQNSSLQNFLQQVDTNNLTLKALRQKLQAEKIASRIGLTPPNPEAEIIYQWGSPVDIGNKTTISITQSFDFPTAFLYRGKIATYRSSLLEYDFRTRRTEILSNALKLYVDYVYHVALVNELTRQFRSAQVIANALRRKMEVGEIGIIPLTQAELKLQEVFTSLKLAESSLKSIYSDLNSINGGIPASITDSVMVLSMLPETFESWIATAEQQNPEIQFLNAQVALGELQVKLSRSESLPSFHAGYASEKVAGEQFQGVVAGIKIPLWEKANTVRYAKANAKQLQLAAEDYLLSFRLRSKSLYDRARSLSDNINQLSSTLDKLDIEAKLTLALEKGEISVVDYYTELSGIYGLRLKLLELQNEYLKTFIELNRYSY